MAFMSEFGGPARSFLPSWKYYQLVNMLERMNLKKQSVNQYQYTQLKMHTYARMSVL